MIDDQLRLALIDFGHTEQIDSVIKNVTGTPLYRPKEASSRRPYKVAPSDIYALASTILVIMFQDIAFNKVNRDEFERIYNQDEACQRFFRILYKSF